MNIEVRGLGKSFNNNRIFRNLTFDFEFGKSYSILGPNGSGKSTLLKILSGYMLPTAGTIAFREGNNLIEPEKWYKYLTLAAPYMELPQELKLLEFLKFHYAFKGLPENMKYDEILEKCGLSGKEDIQIKYFSSGMKQRLKLAISLFSDQKVLLLDEPSVNLDVSGIEWYRKEVMEILTKKLVIIASNSFAEHDFCELSLDLSGLK